MRPDHFRFLSRNHSPIQQRRNFEKAAAPERPDSPSIFNGLDLGNGLRLEPHFDGEGLKLVATPCVEPALPALHSIRSNQGVVISWPNGFNEWELHRLRQLAAYHLRRYQ